MPAKGKVTIGRETRDVERVVTVARLEGPAIPGLPADQDGFLVTDAHGRVQGVPTSTPRATSTSFPLKQGGIACQQADAAAEHIAAQAGATHEPQPYHPVLRGMLLTERWARFLRREGARTSRRAAPCGGRRPRSRAASWPATSRASTKRRAHRRRPPRAGRGQ